MKFNIEIYTITKTEQTDEIRNMSIECDKVGGINLSQGICDLALPQILADSAYDAIKAGENHYTRFDGTAELRKQIAIKAECFNELTVDPNKNIIVSAGATGALYCAFYALLNPGDEVLLFEPFYGYHEYTLRSLDLVPVFSTLPPPAWDIDFQQLESLVTNKTKAILINTPSNPCGKVFSAEELDKLTNFAIKHDRLRDVDRNVVTDMVCDISRQIPDHTVITTDVGQNQVWTAQAFVAKENQLVLFSGGHGAMGYSLPAAIGAHYGTGKRVVSLNGDGGIQMNLQELNLIGQHQLPIKIVVFNNRALGMIRHFQEMYFENNNIHTTQSGGFSAPRFDRIAQAFEIEYYRFDGDFAHVSQLFRSNRPLLLEIPIDMPTYVTPKLAMEKPNQDQDPPLDRMLYDFIMEL